MLPVGAPKYLQLPFSFDEDALLNDLKRINEDLWLPQVYKMNYSGKWTSLALLEPKGEENTTFSYANAGSLQVSAILQQSPYFQYALSQFQCPLLTARLLRLDAGAVIKPHTDFKLGYEDNNFRLHIPIITHNQIEFIIGGEKVDMKPGECWYTNVNYLHSVANRGKIDRIHLVLDGERNDWSDKIFFSLAPKESFGLREETSKEDTLKIIEELKRANLPAAAELIKKLEEGLNED